jgi:uncharacterized Zn finger protein
MKMRGIVVVLEENCMWDNGYPEYVSVAQKKLRAQKKIAALRKKGAVLSPIRIEGRTLARNWWGKAWNRNLELYADYANRLERGRSYILHDAILDLKVSKGIAEGLVQGSASSPYRVKVAIAPLSDRNRAAVRKACEGKIGSMQELLSGKIPKELQALFTAKGTGLFPAPKEIAFSCSCPDSASLCKHVAAVLYGVGARLDDQPEGFFTLRGVEVAELVSEAIAEKTKDLLGKSARPSRRVMAVDDMSALFGIDLAEDVPDPGLTGASGPTGRIGPAFGGNSIPAAPSSAFSKRKPGLAPKIGFSPVAAARAVQSVKPASPEPIPIRKKPGRPRKVISVAEAAKPVATSVASPRSKAAVPEPIPVRKKPGRPRKVISVAEAAKPVTTSVTSPRSKAAVPGPAPIKKKRGRLPKAPAAVSPAKPN